MILDKDISIVVQGPVLLKENNNFIHHITQQVCLRLRKLFPQSEIILSTWQNSNTEDIDFDRLVLSEDPGATWFNYENYELLNNCSRLIISTKAGILAATRKYVFKIRSDLFVVNKNFLKFFYRFTCFDDQYKLVKNRILAFSIYTIKAHQTSLFTMRRPVHISDWAYFGYKEDLFNLYDIPLPIEPEFSQWFLTRCKDFFDIEPGRLWKMPPEQYITSCFFNKYLPINLRHTADATAENLFLSDKLITNNFLVLDQTQFFLISLKYLNFQLLYPRLLSRTALFYSTWLFDYCKHCQLNSLSSKIYYRMIAIQRAICYRILNFSLRNFSKIIGNCVGKLISNKT